MVQISFFLQVIRNLHVSPGKFRGAETVHSLLEEKRQIRSIFPNGKHHRTATVITQVKQMNMIGLDIPVFIILYLRVLCHRQDNS